MDTGLRQRLRKSGGGCLRGGDLRRSPHWRDLRRRRILRHPVRPERGGGLAPCLASPDHLSFARLLWALRP